MIEQIEWVPVAERLPKAYEDVLVVRDYDEVRCVWIAYLADDGLYWYSLGEDPTEGITHWSPLPKGPRG